MFKTIIAMHEVTIEVIICVNDIKLPVCLDCKKNKGLSQVHFLKRDILDTGKPHHQVVPKKQQQVAAVVLECGDSTQKTHPELKCKN